MLYVINLCWKNPIEVVKLFHFNAGLHTVTASKVLCGDFRCDIPRYRFYFNRRFKWIGYVTTFDESCTFFYKKHETWHRDRSIITCIRFEPFA